MKFLKWLLGFAAILAVAVLVLPRLLYPSATVNFRLTYEVDTPEGVKTGSGVWAATYEMLNGYIGWQFWASTEGEAIPVDFGSRGTLYAILSSTKYPAGDGFVSLLIDAFGVRKIIGKHERQSIYNFAAISGRRDLSDGSFDDLLPKMVRFGDEKDPKTVEAVEPHNLAASFGAGVRLAHVTLETTKEPVTRGIEKRLGWLSRYPEPSLLPNSDPRNPPFAALIHHGDFRRITQ